LGHPVAHLGGGLVGKGDGQNLTRADAADGKQVGDPARAAKLIVDLVERGHTGMRVPLGKYAVKKVKDRAASVLREVETAGAIRVLTIHKSKGLGFDVVILPDLEGQHREHHDQHQDNRRTHQDSWTERDGRRPQAYILSRAERRQRPRHRKFIQPDPPPQKAQLRSTCSRS
jgi:hypothetical protein